MNLMARFFGGSWPDCVKKTALWLVLPKNFRSGNILLTTWPSSFFQSSLIGHPWPRFDKGGRVKSPAEGAGGWFDPFSHEKPDRALSMVSLFSASRDAPTWSESGIRRVPQVLPSHGMKDTQPLRAYVNPIE